MQTPIVFFLCICIISSWGCSNTGHKKRSDHRDLVSEAKNGGSRNLGFEMVYINGGDFTMGGVDDVDDGGDPELRIADECPHLVTVEDFWIGKYEVTQADWVEIMGVNPSKFGDCNDCPVERVSWEDIHQ